LYTFRCGSMKRERDAGGVTLRARENINKTKCKQLNSKICNIAYL
jgi:hypothetical protein